jgi:hypothetical protein
MRRGFYLFVNPLDYHVAHGSWLVAMPAVLLFLAGCLVMSRQKTTIFALLMAPFGFTLAATFLHQYPFHGRLVLFLVPAILIMLAAGADWFLERVPGRGGRAVVFAAILLLPTWGAMYHLFESRDRMDFNPHGDRRHARLSPITFPP